MRGHRWNHIYSLALGATGGAAVAGRPWLLLAVFALGIIVGLSLAYLRSTGRRLLSRVDRALPDAERRPISEDDDYLDGIERGIRSARRSAGHEDGRLIERDRLAGRPAP